jgi:hypothetical protein
MRSRSEFLHRQEIFLFSKTFRLVLRSKQPPTLSSWVYSSQQADHSPPYSDNIRLSAAIAPLPHTHSLDAQGQPYIELYLSSVFQSTVPARNLKSGRHCSVWEKVVDIKQLPSKKSATFFNITTQFQNILKDCQVNITHYY